MKKLSLMLIAGAVMSLTVPVFGNNSKEKENTKIENSVKPGKFEAGNGTFLLNGEPYVVKAAELHYPRIPKEYWDQRIKLSKALGMNTICIYAFWNAHEPKEGEFDFSGQNDIREFIKLVQDNGMNVILRPGPYVCAEWEMGGLPWWLLKKKDIRLREDDPYFIERVGKFNEALAGQVGDLTIENGGPIIMVQVENEYGSYGEDKEYIATIRDMLRDSFGEDVTLFQCDWSSNFTLNGLDDLIWTMNFGTGADIDQQFEKLKELRPESPLMCSEFWSGWFDKWGANHETRTSKEMNEGIDEMLSKGISFSLYMTHGGTNWGHWAGANSPGYAPDVTSYDYDAPINENGQPTQKYWELREVMKKYAGGEELPPLPELISPIAIDGFTLTEVAPLFNNLPQAKQDENIKTMEDYDQGFGSIMYSTTLPAVAEGTILTITYPHDYAQVFINGNYIGKLDRRENETELSLPAAAAGSKLDILVEAMGRINFGRAIKDYKGITEKVTLTEGGKTTDLKNWTVYNLPDELAFYEGMNFVPVSENLKENGRYPRGVYKGTFNVEKPSDTFLNFENWGKGLVYVNGYGIGRIWEIGPQQTLYMPGAWLREGENEILVFDIIGPEQPASEGLDKPILDKLKKGFQSNSGKLVEAPDLSALEVLYSGEFQPGNGWQEINFGKTGKGRYFVIEPLSAIDGGDVAAIAELYVLDENGKRIPRESWKTVYVDSENISGENRSADKAYDLQESTYWSTVGGKAFPHLLIIDLGDEYNVSGLQYLPRMEQGAPSSVKGYNVYVKETPFE